MASIQKRRDGRWRARYRDANGKEHAKHFDRKVDAQRWIDEVTASIVTGQYVDPRAGKVTFAAYAAAWQAAQVHRRNTSLAVDSALRVHCVPAFGLRPIGSIRPSEIQAFVKALSGTLAPSSVRTTFQHLRSVFTAAEADRLIARNPCKGVTLPRVEKHRILPLETELVWALHDAMPPDLQAMVTLMATTGLRPGEAAGLTVAQMNFLQRSVLVDRQLIQTRPPTFGPVKTAASVRVVPLAEVTLSEMAAHIAAYPVGGEGTVFSRRDGSPLNRDMVSKAFRKAVTQTGAPAATRLHDLRHYYASLLIRHGESVKVVQARLGHASATETLDTYSHLWPDSEDLTRRAVDAVFGRPADLLRTGQSLAE
jgi:integrase